MEWRQIRRFLQGLHDGIVHQGGFRDVVAAVHNPVADGVEVPDLVTHGVQQPVGLGRTGRRLDGLLPGPDAGRRDEDEMEAVRSGIDHQDVTHLSPPARLCALASHPMG